MARKKQGRFRQWITSAFGRTVEATTKKAGNLIKKVGLAFVTGSGSSGRANFEGPEGFEFEEIEKAYLTDSYIRAATDKYIDFMFKAGWDFGGKNPNAVEYIKQRFSVMSQATQSPTEQLLIEICEELVKYNNVFIVKARASNSYSFPPGIKATPLDGKKPVAGYFVLPTATVTIARDKNGAIKKYKQEIAGGAKPIEIKPEDMIHIHIDKQPGRAFGFPFLWEVLDDVKLLRQMEELVDRMIYKNIFPLMVYQVGLEKEGFQSTDDEIEEVKELLGELSLDGGIVLPERHNIKTVGAEGKALDVEGYLKYFERRVFTGLGVSEMLMGRGDTTNRSTSDNMDAVFKDRIKAYQRIISNFINTFMINELLVEGGFDPILNPQDKVEFRFREIDFDSKIKEENHAIQKFTQNAITHEELRDHLGLDPVTEEGRLYFNMVTASLEANKAAQAQQAANNQGDNKNQPANQHGKKNSPGKKESIEEALTKTQVDSLVSSFNNRWELARAEILDLVRKSKEEIDRDRVKLIANVTAKSMVTIAEKHITSALIEGMNDFRKQSSRKDLPRFNYSKTTNDAKTEMSEQINRLLGVELVNLLEKSLNKYSGSDLIANIVGVFESLKYRLKFIATTETSKTYNIGFSKAAREAGEDLLVIESSEGCDVCSELNGKEVNIYTDRIPPFHPNCSCKLTVSKKEGS